MSRHSNAVGYLIELRDQENVEWFSKLCDLAISSGGLPISETELKEIVKILLGQKQYTPTSATPIAPTTTSTTQPPSAFNINHIRELNGFFNFKKLSDELNVNFDKRITLVFGCNGSGKTSLCEAIKILSKPESPSAPINNVRTQLGQNSSFCYRFDNDQTLNTWDLSKGYGAYSDRIKYFDSTIAVQNITGSVEPEKIVKIAPFRLEIFNYAGSYVRSLNEYMSGLLTAEREKLATNIELIKSLFDGLIFEDEKAISGFSISIYSELDLLLSGFSEIDETERENNIQNINSLESLKKARSPEGLKLQKVELKLLLECGHLLKKALKLISAVSLDEAVQLAKELDSKRTVQQELATKITPAGIDPVHFELFIKASEKVFKFQTIETELCPFCRREFDETSLDLIKSYHEFLLDKVGNEIRQIEINLKRSFSKLKKIKKYSLPTISETIPLGQNILKDSEACIKNNQDLIPKEIGNLKKASCEGFGNTTHLKTNISLIAAGVLQRYRSIKLSSVSEEEFEKSCEKYEEKIAFYNYRKCVGDNFKKLKDALATCKFCNTLEEIIRLSNFPSLLRKVTNKGKESYKDLVVSEFERAVDKEYERMTGMKMSDFGIVLKSTGTEQSVIVDTKIGDEPINRVFSEGEQKIHALSLFFSEAAVSNHQIVVFDDPVTSFDYNYSSKYAERLRDYIIDNPDIQVIVLTHNWDFFVHMQIVLNQSMLNNHTSIKVLEHCCIAEEYSEKIDDLKDCILPILSSRGEPSRDNKDRLAGYLRRLIEAVVNKYVFNGQRHQFKQKTISVSTFNNFTKVVSLNQAEATALRDHYRNLSVPGHEDPRNYYSMKPKAIYSRIYSDICDIKDALISRRP